MSKHIQAALERAVLFLKKYITGKPEIAVVAGSGLGESLMRILSIRDEIPYRDIPEFPVSTVAGHAGSLIIGTVSDRTILLFSGRKHLYEGAPLWHVVFPVLLISSLKVPRIILTNAAGGLNPEYKVGDLMLITEGVNLLFRHFTPDCFPFSGGMFRLDASRIFSPEWREQVSEIARNEGIQLRRGVYIATSGPSYETPSEVGYLRYVGGDAIGMSTVPEAIAAAVLGIKALGISFITNLLAEIPLKKTTHTEVLESSREAGPRLAHLVQIIIQHTSL